MRRKPVNRKTQKVTHNDNATDDSLNYEVALLRQALSENYGPPPEPLRELPLEIRLELDDAFNRAMEFALKGASA
jgi:hypothetical protein